MRKISTALLRTTVDSANLSPATAGDAVRTNSRFRRSKGVSASPIKPDPMTDHRKIETVPDTATNSTSHLERASLHADTCSPAPKKRVIGGDHGLALAKQTRNWNGDRDKDWTEPDVENRPKRSVSAFSLSTPGLTAATSYGISDSGSGRNFASLGALSADAWTHEDALTDQLVIRGATGALKTLAGRFVQNDRAGVIFVSQEMVGGCDRLIRPQSHLNAGNGGIKLTCMIPGEDESGRLASSFPSCDTDPNPPYG